MEPRKRSSRPGDDLAGESTFGALMAREVRRCGIGEAPCLRFDLRRNFRVMQSELAGRLRAEAEVVRWGLEAVPPQRWKGVFRTFPVGCHRPATLVLGLWLVRAGIERVEWVWDAVMRGASGREHCWVEVDGVIVDVTGDRFATAEPRRPPVVVTRDRRWYREQFREGRRLPIDIRGLNVARCSRNEAGELLLFIADRVVAHREAQAKLMGSK